MEHLAPGPATGAVSVAVVGGGWAGLAAAAELTDRGIGVTLFEAAPQWGGRARRCLVQLGDTEIALDNGQHLMLGAYSECLRQIGRVSRPAGDLAGAAPGPRQSAAGRSPAPFLRTRMHIATPDGVLLRRTSWPGTAGVIGGLLGTGVLSAGERWALVRFLVALRWRGWHGFDGLTVSQLLARFRQPEPLVRRLWEPLCIAAMNTEIGAACAQTFVTVLRDSLGAGADASDFITPVSTLGALFPEPAADWLQRHGARLNLRTTVRAIAPADATGSAWRVQATGPGGAVADGEEFAALIMAVPPPNAARLLQELAPGVAARLGEFEFDTIATVYLGWRDDPGLMPVTMLTEDAGRGHFGQWLFARGAQHGWHVGAVVVSAQGRRAAVVPSELARQVAAQAAEQLRLPLASATRVIVEKRATWRCLPTRPLLGPDACTQEGARLRRLWLAGDHACPDRYPATLEGAVRSGVAAARGVAELLALTTGPA